MAQVLEYTASKTGVSVNDILADQTNLSFMNYTRIINVGDPDYLIHVLAHTTGDEVLTFQTEEEVMIQCKYFLNKNNSFRVIFLLIYPFPIIYFR